MSVEGADALLRALADVHLRDNVDQSGLSVPDLFGGASNLVRTGDNIESDELVVPALGPVDLSSALLAPSEKPKNKAPIVLKKETRKPDPIESQKAILEDYLAHIPIESQSATNDGLSDPLHKLFEARAVRQKLCFQHFWRERLEQEALLNANVKVFAFDTPSPDDLVGRRRAAPIEAGPTLTPSEFLASTQQ